MLLLGLLALIVQLHNYINNAVAGIVSGVFLSMWGRTVRIVIII